MEDTLRERERSMRNERGCEGLERNENREQQQEGKEKEDNKWRNKDIKQSLAIGFIPNYYEIIRKNPKRKEIIDAYIPKQHQY